MEQSKPSLVFVKVENGTEKVIIPISTGKQDIPEGIQEKWQKIVDLTARIINVPTGLITKLTPENLEIFAASWEDGELFGTFCMLNDKTNLFSKDFQELMLYFKENIESENTLGISLIKVLTRQLDGNSEFFNDGEAVYKTAIQV